MFNFICVLSSKKEDILAARNARSGYLHDTIVASIGEHSGKWTKRLRKTTEIRIRFNRPSD